MFDEVDERARLWRGVVFGAGLSTPLWAAFIWGCTVLLRTLS